MGVHHRFSSAFAALTLFSLPATVAAQGQLSWDQLPELPPASKGVEQKGLAGLFGGTHNGVLILAGGANFPDAAPWKEGVKTYWGDIFVLEKDDAGKAKWVTELKTKLPKPIAYGSSVSTDAGVLCIGGADLTQCYTGVFLLKWNPGTKDVEIVDLPPLPVALAHSTASKIGDIVYVAGGVSKPFGEGTKAFFALDLNPEPESVGAIEDPEDSASATDTATTDPKGEDKGAPDHSETAPTDETGERSEPAPIKPEVIDEDPDEAKTPNDDGTKGEGESEPKKEIPLEWKELTTWDGDPRAFATSAAQSDGEKECFFLFSGRNPMPDGTSRHLFDAHKYDPAVNQWVKFPDIAPPDSNPKSVVAASASPRGDRSILIFGGDDGTMAKVSSLVVAASNSTSRDAYLKLNQTILENHPGYSRDILSLDTVDGIWSNADTFPESCPVTTPAITWDEAIIIPSGEIRPGVRSTKIWRGIWKDK